MENNERTALETDFTSANNEELEEADDLEDQQRREEEIYNLLSHAMDEFNYDQSTINSSIVSNYANNSMLLPQTAIDEQYREASADDQLKVLYEVRVREVEALSKEVERLNAEYKEQEQKLKKSVTLLEIENNRNNISLKEVQDLLVEKVDQIKVLQEQMESLKVAIKNLETHNVEVKEENVILHESNSKLEEHILLMERGFPLRKKINTHELQTALQTKVVQLENSLKIAVEQSNHREQQHKELVRELKQSLQERDNCAIAKDTAITKLTEDFENMEKKCQKLLGTIEDLKQTQKATECTESPLEEELRKMREYNERTDVLCENVRKAVSEEFQGQISMLHTENEDLKEALRIQDCDFKEIRQKLQVLCTIETEKNDMQGKLTKLQDEFIEINLDRETTIKKLANCEKIRDSLKENNVLLIAEISSLSNTKTSLQNRIVDLESYISEINNRTQYERSVQTSFSSATSSEIIDLRKEKEDIYVQLISAHNFIEELENKIEQSREENAQLKVKIGLEQEREVLIKKLQEKAAEFERLIFERQQELIPCKTTSIGINTDSIPETGSMLKVQYDALLYQTEATLRENLKKEFDAKLKKIISNSDQEPKLCEYCKCFGNEIKKLQELRVQDRQAIAKLVDSWMTAFADLEKDSEHNRNKLKDIYEEHLSSALLQLQQDFTDKNKKTYKHLNEAAAKLEHQKNNVIQFGLQQHTIICEKLNRILLKFQQGSEEVVAVENNYLKHKAALEKDNSS